MKFVDLTGLKFSRLTVMKRIGYAKDGHITWSCLCECGKEIIVPGNSLRSGNTKSCGCLYKEKIKNGLNLKHGLARNKKSKIYKTWQDMKSRCFNKNNKDYKNYGERGITVCERWLNKKTGFENFLEDIGEIPKGLTLDRIDNNGNYDFNNWKLSSRKEQRRNQRWNRPITFNNKTQFLIDWAKEYNINPNTLWIRLYRLGWSIEKALTTPVKKYRKKIK
jgi:hypothetical protein